MAPAQLAKVKLPAPAKIVKAPDTICVAFCTVVVVTFPRQDIVGISSATPLKYDTKHVIASCRYDVMFFGEVSLSELGPLALLFANNI
jgi:hypothetical protein